jgi:hypothetical protein
VHELPGVREPVAGAGDGGGAPAGRVLGGLELAEEHELVALLVHDPLVEEVAGLVGAGVAGARGRQTLGGAVQEPVAVGVDLAGIGPVGRQLLEVGEPVAVEVALAGVVGRVPGVQAKIELLGVGQSAGVGVGGGRVRAGLELLEVGDPVVVKVPGAVLAADLEGRLPAERARGPGRLVQVGERVPVPVGGLGLEPGLEDIEEGVGALAADLGGGAAPGGVDDALVVG